MNEIQTCSTIFHTPSGDIEIPNDIQATAESRVAPLWLVFPGHIINTQQIVCIQKSTIGIYVTTTKGSWDIKVSNPETTFKLLQNVFANGVAND